MIELSLLIIHYWLKQHEYIILIIKCKKWNYIAKYTLNEMTNFFHLVHVSVDEYYLLLDEIGISINSISNFFIFIDVSSKNWKCFIRAIWFSSLNSFYVVCQNSYNDLLSKNIFNLLSPNNLIRSFFIFLLSSDLESTWLTKRFVLVIRISHCPIFWEVYQKSSTKTYQIIVNYVITPSLRPPLFKSLIFKNGRKKIYD